MVPKAAISALALTLAISACGRHERTATPAGGPRATASAAVGEEKVLNVYNWADYIDPSVIPAFEKEYGIKVNYDVFDSNDVLETKLLAGKTGYDIVVPTAPFMQRQIQAGVYQKLDKTLLPNLDNLDENLNRSVEVNDPGNQYGVIYFWGTSGIGYNEEKIAAAMPSAPFDSFAMLYDPSVIKNFKECGVSILDAPDEVVETVLLYLGKDPNSESLVDLKAVESTLQSIRPYVRYINSSKYIEDLANGEICIALLWSGDIGQVRSRAKEAGRNMNFGYILAKDGAMMFFDMLAIPADAPHPINAHLLINFLLRSDVAAKNSSTVHYATSNKAAYKLVDPELYNDRSVYLTGEQRARLHPMGSHTPSYTRELNRMWTRFKTGR
jgi:putrescine transport system substrate-binding protein